MALMTAGSGSAWRLAQHKGSILQTRGTKRSENGGPNTPLLILGVYEVLSEANMVMRNPRLYQAWILHLARAETKHSDAVDARSNI